MRNILTLAMASILITSQALALDSVVREDKIKLGKKASSSNKVIEFDTNAGAANPKIQANKSNGKLEFAKDGVNFKELGSGSGGGSGVNLLTGDENPGFEDGTTAWTSSGGSFTSTSVNPLYGETSGVWDASASGQTLSSGSKSIKEGLKGQSCLAGISYKYAGTSGDYKLQVYDGTNVLAEQSLEQATSPTDAFLGFACPSSGSVRARLISAVANPGAITLDGPKQSGGLVHLGSNMLLSEFSQAEHVGTLTYPTAANCAWLSASGTFANYSADTDCSAPTVTGKLSAPGTKIPGFVINGALPGVYYVVAHGLFFNNAAAGTAEWRFSDGTNNFGYGSAPAASGELATVSGTVSYSTTSNITIQIQATENAGGGSADVRADAANRILSFDVFRFPTTSQTALASTANTALQGEYKLTGCASSPSASTGAYADFDSPAGCTLTYVKGTLTNGVLGGSGAGSIAFTASKVGQTFEVCASGQSGGAGGAGYIQIVDNQGNPGEAQFNATGSIVPFRICTNATSTSLSAMTVKLQGANSSSSTSIQGPGIGTRFLSWSIKDVSSSFPMPYLVKQIVSESSGNERIERATIGGAGAEPSSCTSSPCTVIRQSGSWLTAATRSGAGQYAVTFTSFADRPSCTCSGTANACTVNITSASGANVNTNSADDEFHLLCMGPK